MPHRVRGKGASLGRAVLDVFHSGSSRRPPAPRKTSRGAPPGRAMKSVLPAPRQAAGAPSAWSQPFNPRSAGERVRSSSQSEDGSDRSRARVGRGARSALAINHSSDHADGATLGRWGARTSQRPRRPVTRKSRTVAVSGTGAEAATVSDSDPVPVPVPDPDPDPDPDGSLPRTLPRALPRTLPRTLPRHGHPRVVHQAMGSP